jgi:hypothetical protein
VHVSHYVSDVFGIFLVLAAAAMCADQSMSLAPEKFDKNGNGLIDNDEVGYACQEAGHPQPGYKVNPKRLWFTMDTLHCYLYES